MRRKQGSIGVEEAPARRPIGAGQSFYPSESLTMLSHFASSRFSENGIASPTIPVRRVALIRLLLAANQTAVRMAASTSGLINRSHVPRLVRGQSIRHRPSARISKTAMQRPPLE
jgi:hypothetical protein